MDTTNIRENIITKGFGPTDRAGPNLRLTGPQSRAIYSTWGWGINFQRAIMDVLLFLDSKFDLILISIDLIFF